MSGELEAASRLREVTWKRFLRAPDAQLLEELYVPGLARAVRYDRCCAYFSSHVLSVAARGFAGLIEKLTSMGDKLPKPSVRLLVNEQLDPKDLDALLATGDVAPLAEKLLKQFHNPQEALERDRLAMLTWLVARGWLEVQVGLMRHGQGIMHAKFGLLTDGAGDCIAFSGSDNETGQALVDNYEELVLGTSWEDLPFTAYFRERFEALWNNRDDQVTTVPLPEAVRLKLIKLAPSQPPTTEPNPNKEDLKAAMLWSFIAASPYLPRGEYACDATALVDLWPHQRRVVEDTARAFPAGRLLCDEVGMGKTIEAILLLRRLLAGRGVQRALLLVPAGLLRQWQDELREKGGLLVPRWENGLLCQPDGCHEHAEMADVLAQNDLLLLSREWARLENNRAQVLSAPSWDLVLVDEAHAARRRAGVEREYNSANLLLQLLRELQLRRRTRGILLLSATPMQTEPWEPWDLLSILGVGGRWLVDFADIRTYYGGVAALHRKDPCDLPIAEAIARLVADDAEFPPLPNGQSAQDVDVVREALTFCTSEERTHLGDWLRRGAPLGRYMHRSTRDTLRRYYSMGLLPAPPPRREVRDEVFDFQDPAERACYEAITDYIDRRFDELEQEKAGKGFIMTIYRRRAASSPLAFRRSLEHRLDKLERVICRQWAGAWLRPEDEQVDIRDLLEVDQDEQIDPGVPADPKIAGKEAAEVRELLKRLDALRGVDSKLARFWEILRETTADGRAALVFSEYADTMEYLRDQLRPNYGETLACYSGAGGQVWEGAKWVGVSKADITERLSAGKLRVLVCTDAASEGLNLQAASALVNYDLPWNPSKVEQRIGRIDRIGQLQAVLPIRNLFLEDSVDMRVYAVLRKRCGLFVHFVGPMQPVLAIAWKALQNNPKPSEAEALIEQLNREASKVEADPTVANVFVASQAEPLSPTNAPVTRRDVEQALNLLTKSSGKVKARPVKGARVWQLSGLERATIRVTLDRETLERDAKVLPLGADSRIVARLAEKLPLTGRSPLVLAEYASGSYRSIEVRWVQGNHIRPIGTFEELWQLCDAWDGTPPAPALVLQAQDEAHEAARERVRALEQRDKAEEEAALRRQLEAARRRLLRELGRTLRCIGRDLNAVFRQQVSREKLPDGRYHRALKLLGGYPAWGHEEQEDAQSFREGLSNKDLVARIAGSEIDAALNDPRWMARGSL